MTHIITSLCVRDGSCIAACPVDCIVPGFPQEEWPIYYIDPITCIDCGACIPECPVGAIFIKDDAPSDYLARGGEILVARLGTPGFENSHDCYDYEGNDVHLNAVRILKENELIDLSGDIKANENFFNSGPGYTSQL
ncbi:MAG: ferredoxin family protein [Anaerolineaceae bacterium]|nr:ferredoxin family protein [Anaerolineaceae bacterium]